MVGQIKELELNLAALLQDILYHLQDEATVELHAREGRVVKMISEKKINIEQLILQRNEVVAQNQ